MREDISKFDGEPCMVVPVLELQERDRVRTLKGWVTLFPPRTFQNGALFLSGFTDRQTYWYYGFSAERAPDSVMEVDVERFNDNRS